MSQRTGASAAASQDTVTRVGPGARAPAQAAGQAAPAPVVPAPVAPADPLAEAKKYRDEGAAERAAAEKARRVHAVEARKFADEKKGIGAKLSEYERLVKWEAEQKKLDAQAKLNKSAFLKAKFGDDWYDQVTQERISGGAPTADTVGLEVERAKEELRKEFEEREQKRLETERQTQQAQAQAELRDFHRSAADFAKANLKDFPVLEGLGDEQAIGATLVQRIRAEHDRTTVRDESGAITQRGRVLTMKEAAEAVENDLVAIAERAASAEKYREKLTGKLKPVQSGVVGGAPQLRSTEERRTLSNGLTATTPGQKPTYRSDEERRAAAYAAVDRVKAGQA